MRYQIIDSTRSIWKKANLDLISGLRNWRVAYIIGKSEISSRYQRSKLGQFWITLSLVINIVILSLVWSYLWKINIKEFMPYYSFSFILWLYMTGIIIDSSSLFYNNRSFISGSNTAINTYIIANIFKNNIILMHNIVLLPIIFILCGVYVSLLSFVQFLIALLLLTLMGYATSVILSIICLRFKDVQSIVQSLIQIAFFVTPVIWKIDFLSERIQTLVLLNPFAVFLLIMRNPIFGIETPLFVWGLAIVEVVIMMLLAYIMFSKFRHKVAYWI